jgi:uncharacterized protein (DUF433 family)
MKITHYLAEGLDRITVDSQQAKSQPSIRGTTISVWDIVKLLIRRGSASDVLDIYPDLEPDDIRQSLIFAVRELTDSIMFWRNEGLGPTTLIQGYSKMLLGKDDFDHIQLTDELIQQSTESIFVNSHRAMAAWWHLGGWMQLFYGYGQRTWQPFSLDSILKSVRNELPRYEPHATVEILASDELPPVRGDYDLSYAIVNIMTDRASYYLDLHSVLSAKLENPEVVTVQIQRKFKYPQSIQVEMEHVFDWNCSPLSVAARIIREHGSTLQVHTSEEAVTFEFLLPIWTEPQQ